MEEVDPIYLDSSGAPASAGNGSALDVFEERETLVLSSGYEPVARVDWRRAMGMWVAERADVLETYPHIVVHSAHATFPMPAVIRFAHASAWRRVFIRFSRDNVHVRDGGICQYCGKAVSRARSTWDHVMPRSRGGRTSWDNVVLACKPCNQRKGNRTPEEAGMKLRSRPRKPNHLPSLGDGSIAYRPGMPEQWRPYLRTLGVPSAKASPDA